MTRRGVVSVALVGALALVIVAAAVDTGSTGSSSAATTSATQATQAAAPATTGAAAATTAATCTPMSPGLHRLASIDGRIPVVLHIGRHAKPGAPLILGIPGAGQTARDFASYTGYSTLADREGFSVAYPTATGSRPFWNISGTQSGKPDDLAYLRKVIPAAVHAACANPRRVGVTGVSNGGGMSARLACDAADLVAAAAPVAGGYGSLPDCHPSRPVPILEVHSTADRVVPYEGRGRAASGAVGAFLAQWRSLDHCSSRIRTTRPYADIVEQRWNRCGAGTVVQHDRVSDQDHGWPGQNDLTGHAAFSSTKATYAFLSRFRLPAA